MNRQARGVKPGPTERWEPRAERKRKGLWAVKKPQRTFLHFCGLNLFKVIGPHIANSHVIHGHKT